MSKSKSEPKTFAGVPIATVAATLHFSDEYTERLISTWGTEHGENLHQLVRFIGRFWRVSDAPHSDRSLPEISGKFLPTQIEEIFGGISLAQLSEMVNYPEPYTFRELRRHYVGSNSNKKLGLRALPMFILDLTENRSRRSYKLTHIDWQPGEMETGEKIPKTHEQLIEEMNAEELRKAEQPNDSPGVMGIVTTPFLS